MALTKPAGCVLQGLALTLMLGSCFGISSSLQPSHPLSYGGLIAGIFFMFIGAWLFVKGRTPALPHGGRATKKCPACAEEVLAEARKCKHCGEVIQ